MRILFVVPYVPNQVHVRSYNLVKTLASRGHQITLATLWSRLDDLPDIARLAMICHQTVALPLPKWRSYLNSLLAIATPNPLQSAYCWEPEFARRLGSLIDEQSLEQPFDIIHVEHLRGARYGLALEQRAMAANFGGTRKPFPPIIWDSVDNISVLFRQAAVQSRRFLSRLMTRFELSRTQRYESHLLEQFSHILVTSQNDRKAFIELLPAGGELPEISVIPNGVDSDFFAPCPGVERQPETLVISGKMSYHANVTMCLNFASQVMPLVWAQRPEVKLWLVGKDPSSELVALGKNPAIKVTGTVPDIRPYLQQATLAVAPLTYGTGIQNKVLEAMACATPVVSTPQAASALAAIPGQDIAVGASPQELAHIILGLLNDPEKRDRMGRNGKAYIEKNHRWEDIAARLEEVYCGALQNETCLDLR